MGNLFAEEVAELWEPWMSVVDELLEDEELPGAVYDAQGQRHSKSRTRGRYQTPAEVVLRMLILKHVRNWSYKASRISALTRRHGLARCRYLGMDRMRRWVGLGVIADNLINIGKRLVPKLA